MLKVPGSPAGISLSTRKNRPIPNEKPDDERPTDLLLAAATNAIARVPGDIAIRSLSSCYNCMGMMFACRRTSIDVSELDMIIEDDGYRTIEEGELKIGDIVVYSRDGVEASHVAQVVALLVDPNVADPIRVLSKWGVDGGEYFHPMRQVSEAYGVPFSFLTDRPVMQ